MAFGLNALHMPCRPALSPRIAMVTHGAARGWEEPVGRHRQHRLGSGLQPHRPHEPLVRLGVSGIAVPEPHTEFPELRPEHNSQVGYILPLLFVLIHPRNQDRTTCVDAVTHMLRGALPRATPLCAVQLRVSGRELLQDIEYMHRAYAQAWMGYERLEVRIVTTTLPHLLHLPPHCPSRMEMGTDSDWSGGGARRARGGRGA